MNKPTSKDIMTMVYREISPAKVRFLDAPSRFRESYTGLLGFWETHWEINVLNAHPGI